jgi:hypothetical protein
MIRKFFPRRSDLHLGKKLLKNATFGTKRFRVLTLRHFGNTWKVLKNCAGEGWRGSFGLIVWEMKYCMR